MSPISSLSGSELQFAYDSLLRLKRTIVNGESKVVADPDEPVPECSEQQVDTILSLLGSKMEGPQPLTSFRMTVDDLTKLKVMFIGFIGLKPNSKEQIVETTFLGQNELWSSANLYGQLHVLESLIPRRTKASARAWIDTFFFCASAMLPPDQRILLYMEDISSATIGPSRFVDYTAVVTSQCLASFFQKSTHLDVLTTHVPSSFFVIEAKLVNPSDDIPQAVYKMYTCGRLLQKKVLHGALTNGYDWIFLLIKFNDNFDGASYMQSTMVQLCTIETLDGQPVIPAPWPDLIAAILSHWIKNNFVDLGSDDWFEPIH
ncbi:hypothetical protein BJV77DRAFT_1069301 [Russula vinacea]|nr:hypothetical protein BJV77DRAFT_1069301 [Russula vinacea]